MKIQSKSYGYYFVSITLPGNQRFMKTNNERAFVISQLQDLLSMRLLIGSVPAHKQLASCIDLLAFSITSEAIQLIVFTIDASILTYLTDHIPSRLAQYQSEYQAPQGKAIVEPRVYTKKLRGPHQALARSVELHSWHEDWEYDRYSSIGFYLHDRRGDWMRTWRLSQLYDNEPLNYRLLIESQVKYLDTMQAKRPSFAS
ncbi:MAG: hypothetical protein ACOH18_00660 [Candidatus Saccharimonadaceae bacterium]